MRCIALSAVLLLAACAGKPVDPVAACTGLQLPIPASAIGLPSGGASIDTAILVAPSALAVRPAAARSRYCPGAARVLPGHRHHRAGRSEGAADPLPGEPADGLERQFAAVRRRRLQRRADQRPRAHAL